LSSLNSRIIVEPILQTLVEVDTLGHFALSFLLEVLVKFGLEGAHNRSVQGTLLWEQGAGSGHHEAKAKHQRIKRSVKGTSGRR